MEFWYHDKFGWVTTDAAPIAGSAVRPKPLKTGLPVTLAKHIWPKALIPAEKRLTSLEPTVLRGELALLQRAGFSPSAELREALVSRGKRSNKVPSKRRSSKKTQKGRATTSPQSPRVLLLPAGTVERMRSHNESNALPVPPQARTPQHPAKAPATLGAGRLAFDAVLFDLDGTLAPTKNLSRARLHRGQDEVRALLPDIRPYPGIAALLTQLAASDIPVGIVTDAPNWYADMVLTHLFPKLNFAAVITFNDVEQPKPAPFGVKLARHKLNAREPQRVVYVGDSKKDLDAAYLGGVRSVLAQWGEVDESEELPPPDANCATPDELVEFLRRPQAWQPWLESASEGGKFGRWGCGRATMQPMTHLPYYYLGRYYPPNSMADRSRGVPHKLSSDVHAKYDAGHVRFPDYWHQTLKHWLQVNKNRFDLVTVIPAKMDKPKRLEALLESAISKLSATARQKAKTDIFAFDAEAGANKSRLRRERVAETEKHLHLANSGSVRGKTVVVIDDVITTGATLARAKNLLDDAGCRKAIVLACAKTINPPSPMTRNCEACGGVMVPLENSSDGSLFWGCKNWRARGCRNTIDLNTEEKCMWIEMNK